MRAPALADAVTHLPGLLPCAASLLTLARAPAGETWAHLRTDPAAVLLLLRQAAGGREPSGLSFFPALPHQPAVLESAARLVTGAGIRFVDWSQPGVLPVYQSSLLYARLAAFLAEQTQCTEPDHAWVAALLAPLGWFAVCAVAPAQAAECLADPDLARDPVTVQANRWGLDQAGIARRLNRRWRLPRWLGAVTGHLELNVETAALLGADPKLFLLTQLALGLAQRHGRGLHLAVGATPEESASGLGVPTPQLDEWEQALERLLTPPAAATWESPREMHLLADLLLLAAENRRLAEAPVLEGLENDVDQLHRLLREQRASEEERLRVQRLAALAEMAAGAGHEINNPLAVISGQAQYLLRATEHGAARVDAGDSDFLRLPRSEVRTSLTAIVTQAQRVHEILSAMMQFARPARPQKQAVDVAAMVRDVAESMQDLAAGRRVAVKTVLASPVPTALADPRQLHVALTCLCKNAVEAAPADGWVAVRVEKPAPDRLDVVVEDNGPGLTRAQREHLFDPFFSGRPAGRGRGLGLSTAWRLARENGGEVRFEELPQGPTRFVLSLPSSPSIVSDPPPSSDSPPLPNGHRSPSESVPARRA